MAGKTDHNQDLDDSSQQKRVLLVDHNSIARHGLSGLLQDNDYDVASVPDWMAALEYLVNTSSNVVVTELDIPELGGMELLRNIKESYPSTEVIFTGSDDARIAVKSLKAGAYDYLPRPITDEEVLSSINDCLEEQESKEKSQTAAERLAYLAYTDSLTGLHNRASFNKRLKETLDLAKRFKQENMRALIYIDIDKFKPVNDTFGHQAGDELLEEVGKRIKDCSRETDYACRIGGDEFAVILTNIDNSDSPEYMAQRIQKSISAPYEVGGKKIDYISSSMGISVFPRDGLDMDTIIKKADAAMYQVKESGRNGYRFYDYSMGIKD